MDDEGARLLAKLGILWTAAAVGVVASGAALGLAVRVFAWAAWGG